MYLYVALRRLQTNCNFSEHGVYRLHPKQKILKRTVGPFVNPRPVGTGGERQTGTKLYLTSKIKKNKE